MLMLVVACVCCVFVEVCGCCVLSLMLVVVVDDCVCYCV